MILLPSDDAPKVPRPVLDWSEQQLAIFDDVISPSTVPLIVRARAGASKTTTLVEAMFRVHDAFPQSRSLLVAFNKLIAGELDLRKPPNATVLTLHALGHGILRRAWGENLTIQRWKSKDLLKVELKKRKLTKGFLPKELHDTVSLCKARLCLTPEAIERTIATSVLEPELLKPIGEAVLAALRASCKRSEIIDFDDMIFLPAVLTNLEVTPYDRVIIDEMQDITRAQLVLAQRLVKPTGRLIGIGDDLQAIYGWRGADVGCIDRMIADLNAVERKLTVTFRCPRRVVALVNDVVPDLRAKKDAPEGSLHFHAFRGTALPFRVGDAVLSRTNAPLIKLMLQAMTRGLPVRMQNMEFVKEVQDLITTLAGKRTLTGRRGGLEHLQGLSDEALSKQTLLFEAAEASDEGLSAEEEEKHLKTCDLHEVLTELASVSSSVADLKQRLTQLSEKKEGDSVLFSSVHGAKGLEWPRVWVLTQTFNPEKTDEDRNLWYVALTRTKNELHLVSDAEPRCVESAIVRYALQEAQDDRIRKRWDGPPVPMPTAGEEL